MDEKATQILKPLAELETTSTDAVSEETGIPLSTIHYRLNNLHEDGIITNDRLDLDPDEFGLGVTVLVQLYRKDDQPHRESGQAIADIEGVTKVFFTTGRTDFIALARLPNSDSVARLISDLEALDQVARTDSTFVIERALDSGYPLQQYSPETLIEEFAE